MRKILIWTFFVTASLFAAPFFDYASISDLFHPSSSDYYAIQNYLTYGERRGLEKLKDTERQQRNFRIIGSGPNEEIQSGLISVNTDIHERENCLVLYASFNQRFPEGLKRLVKIVQNSDFKGHILYRIGGWPDLEGGSLVLAHVPFAFKVCAIKEAQRLGYKRVLWLDSSVVPLISLNRIFDMIAEKGYFVFANFHPVGPYCNSEVAEFFGYTHRETYSLLSCQAGMTGVDLTSERGREIVDLWYKAAQDKNAFFSARSDQTALSLVFHKLRLTEFLDIRRAAEPGRIPVTADSILLVDRNSVN
jgi:hypothetical protein